MLTLSEARQQVSLGESETGFDDLLSLYIDAADDYIRRHVRADLVRANPTGTPATLKQAALLLVGHWFKCREDADVPMREIPHGVNALIALHKDWSL